MAENHAALVLKTLQSALTMPQWAASSNAYKTLVRTIISQNTFVQNTTRAFENLSKHFEIRPELQVNAGTLQSYFKARHPLYEKCPINMYCPTKGQWK